MGNFLAAGAVSAALAVGFGAFGAHGLEETLRQNGYTEVYKTAVLYHIIHSLGILLLALAGVSLKNINMKLPLYFLSGGTLLFSGSLYALSLTEAKFLGAITPAGGVLFIAGWLVAAARLYKYKAGA